MLIEVVLQNLGHQSGKLFVPRYRRYRGIGALSSFYDGSLQRDKVTQFLKFSFHLYLFEAINLPLNLLLH